MGKILVIEGDGIMRALISHVLVSQGQQVLTAGDGEAAWNSLWLSVPISYSWI